MKLIAADLKTKESQGFGEFKIHRALTIAQLDELRELRAGSAPQRELRPHPPGASCSPAPTPIRRSMPAAREAYLEQRLGVREGARAVVQLAQGAHPLPAPGARPRPGQPRCGALPDYVKLPRNAPYIRPEWRRDQKAEWKHAADCNRDYRSGDRAAADRR